MTAGRATRVLVVRTAVVVAVLVIAAAGGTVAAHAVASSSTSSYATTVLADAPAGYWRLGERSGTSAADASGNGHTGVYSGAVTLGVPGAIDADPDTAAAFDGATGKVSVADSPNLRLNGPFSVEFWAQESHFANTYPGILSKGDANGPSGYLIYYLADGSLSFKRDNIEVPTTAGQITTGGYRYFVVTYDGSMLRWYVNGTVDSFQALTYPPSAGPGALQLGQADDAGAETLDEVAVYNRALSAAQVSNHYQVGTTGIPAAPPGAPTGVTAVAGNASATVSWTLPTSNGGSPITGYTVTASPGGATATSGPAETSAPVAGLTNSISYTFTVTATNGLGTGPPSTPSTPVIPMASPPVARDTTAGDWPGYVYDPQGSGRNPNETSITVANAPTLKPKWVFRAPDAIDDEVAVAFGSEFVGDFSGHIRAVTPAGIQRWSAFLGTTAGPCTTVGVASSPTAGTIGTRQVIFVGGGDAAVYALDANTGAVIWRTALGDPAAGNFIFSSPLLYNGSIYIGLSSEGDCPLVQGRFVRLDAATGILQATLSLAPDGCVGGGVWGSASTDGAGYLYFATGTEDACSTPDPLEISVVKVDAVHLRVAGYWHLPESQQGPDGDFGSVPTIFSANAPGTSGRLVAIANKNGIFYAFDRDNLARGPVWAVRIAVSGACATCDQGAISPAAYAQGRLYTAAGRTTTHSGASCATALRAINPATGAIIWEDCYDGPTDGPAIGPTSTADGVVTIGEGQSVVGVQATTGRPLFKITDTGPEAFFYAGPTIAHGVIYAGNVDGALYTLSPASPGYWFVAADGGVFSFNAPFYGSAGGARLNQPVVGMATTPDGKGYWLVARDGGIFSFGDARFYGSTGNIRLNQPIVGMAADSATGGYWFVAADGGVFSFNAPFYGSAGGARLNQPVVGMATTHDGKGYWLVARDGGIFSFGDARFYGSTGNIRLNQPIVGMAADSATGGYWFVAADGGVFSFNAPFYGSAGGARLNQPVVGMATTPDGKGYWLVARDGGIFSFGDARFYGSTGNIRLNQPIVGMAGT